MGALSWKSTHNIDAKDKLFDKFQKKKGLSKMPDRWITVEFSHGGMQMIRESKFQQWNMIAKSVLLDNIARKLRTWRWM